MTINKRDKPPEALISNFKNMLSHRQCYLLNTSRMDYLVQSLYDPVSQNETDINLIVDSIEEEIVQQAQYSIQMLTKIE
ncbi:hypothetical protein O9G_001743 [Rozella allomycis CSF55]|uniref:Uncharacterized protein n=1 Tax=Rozella allomycis (strain CSF55) TaxID=988480 RepID=A0A075ASS0_ROZAC|nr:hypothetical protein O9G_001743 [Rozella allomycis CSF55]|eukprot:EPZ33331.1 hypothetical protein O9G_001743 [Rozella allomycis CSF55]